VLAVALARGEVDIAPVDGRIWAAIAERSKASAGGGTENGVRSGMTPLKVAEFNGNRTVYLGFNMQREPWKQLLVRRALAQAINRQALARVFYGGYAVLPDSDVPITSWAFSKDTRALKYDLKEAQELLQQAGYVRRGGRWFRGEPLALRIHTIKEQEEIAQAVADYLGKLGVEAEVAVMEYSTLRRSCLKPGKFDAILWSRSYGPDPECSVVWSSKGPLNFCKLQVSEVDGLIALGRTARSREERALAYGKLQKYLSEELPWVFLAQPKQLLAYKEGLKGVQKGQQQSVGLPWDNPVFNAADWQF
jgi:ABC-type transport system substrate-binding protein